MGTKYLVWVKRSVSQTEWWVISLSTADLESDRKPYSAFRL